MIAPTTVAIPIIWITVSFSERKIQLPRATTTGSKVLTMAARDAGTRCRPAKKSEYGRRIDVMEKVTSNKSCAGLPMACSRLCGGVAANQKMLALSRA